MIGTKRSTLLALPLLAALAAPAAAQQATRDTVPRYRLEGIEVSVTRGPVRAEDAPQRIDVITAAELRRTPASELADVLKKHAAVDVIQYAGLLSGVSVRGFRPQFFGINQRTLVLVDGRPAGSTNLAILPMNDIERVEVLKGPASALYGTNAMGGVVNVITRRSQGRIGGEASLGYGSWQTAEAALRVGGRIAPALDFDFGVALLERGADYRTGEGNLFHGMLGDGTLTRAGVTVADTLRASGELRPHSRYGTQSANLRLGYRVDERLRLDVRADRFQADGVQNPGDVYAVGYDSRTLKDIARTSGDVALSGALGRHTPLLRLFGTEERSQDYNAPEASAAAPQFVNLRSPTRTTGLQLQNAARLGAHTLTAGVDVTAASARSERFGAPGSRIAPYSPDSERLSRAAFAELRAALLGERLVSTVGGRLDRIDFRIDDATLFDGRVVTANAETFDVLTPSFGLQARLGDGVRLNATRGRAFVTPDAFHVAGYSEARTGRRIAVTRGNPELDPENSVTHDVGVALVRRDLGLDAELTLFRTDVRDRITTRRTVPPAPTLSPAGDSIVSVTTYVNANRAEIRGAEWRVGYDLGPLLQRDYALRVSANATHILRAEEITGDNVVRIRNVADLTLNYGLEYDDRRRLSARLGGRYVGERTDQDFSDWTRPADVVYPRFMTLDLSADVRLTERYRVGLLVDNLTDENYFEKRGYNLPGRAVRVRVGVDW